MTFRYTDPDGHHIDASPETDWHAEPVVTLRIRGEYATALARIPADLVEEFIAGLRDTARQTTTKEARP